MPGDNALLGSTITSRFCIPSEADGSEYRDWLSEFAVLTANSGLSKGCIDEIWFVN
jgi:hypothetical protein